MKLRISTIAPEGADLDFAIDAHRVRTLLKDNDSLREAVKKPIEVHLNAQKIRDNVTLRGEYYTEIEPVCDRCLENFDLAVHGKVDLTCIPKHKVDDEDEGVLPYSSDVIDLTPVIHTQLMLGMPLAFHCDEDCKGLCPSCGHNLNKGACPTHGSDANQDSAEESIIV